TMKTVVDNYSYSPRYQNTVVVPARGGMERNLQTEANTLAANFADKLGASYKLIHVPDNLSNEALSTIINEKSIKNAIGVFSNRSFSSTYSINIFNGTFKDHKRRDK
ncbi:sugar-binding domain-containing protein, partial [Escherichia coli]|nr:sugar-binding domain-containing protein [Escherichia coli]